jgi:DNA-binding MarR family transcriptional regulator
MRNENVINIENTVLPWLGRTTKVLDYFIADKFKEGGCELTKVQLILLKILKDLDGQSQNSLAYLTNRDKASLARLLNTMEKKNLVERIQSKSDHRINHIYLTKHGEYMLKQAAPIMQDVIIQIQQEIPAQNIEVVINTMKKIIRNINSEELVAMLTK